MMKAALAWQLALVLTCCLLAACRTDYVEISEPFPIVVTPGPPGPTPRPSPVPVPVPTPIPTPEPDPTPGPPVNAEYFEQLRREYNNDDIVGYLKIEGTSIDYLVVQAEDNEFYLDRNIHKERCNAGWVFLDYENDTSRDDLHTIIYAHNMREDIMFHSIRYYTSKDFFENHRFIIFNTDYADQTWEIFSFHQTFYGPDFNFIQMYFPTHDHFVRLLMQMKSRSMYDTGVDVSPSDRVLTLVTCVGAEITAERYVVHARLLDR